MSEVVSELRSLVASSLFSRAARILVPISRMLSFDTLRYSEILSVQTKLFDMYSLKRSRVVCHVPADGQLGLPIISPL